MGYLLIRESNVWCPADSAKALTTLANVFRDTPRCFLTEHDLHSYLFKIVESQLCERGKLFSETIDKQKVSLVHHEYPTPFRCDMSNHGFSKVEETDKTAKGGLFRRGHYDLVVLNPEFVKAHELITVAGKNYKHFYINKDKIQATPLLWACEVVFGSHYGDKLPKKWEDYAIQDANKLLETMRFTVGNNLPFLAEGSAIIFLGTKSNRQTKEIENKLIDFSNTSKFNVITVTM
jgi:hypothetical protein